MTSVAELPEAEQDAVVRDMQAASERSLAEFHQRLDAIINKFNAMACRAERAVEDGIRDEGVLAYCRERIEVPDELPLCGRLTVGDIKRRHERNMHRHATLIDAMLRGDLEAHLTMQPGDFH